MELRHVRAFLVLADELHFGRTAARLRVAQSAVSQTLKNLEEEIGVRLFERTQRKVSLTAAGLAFLPHARASLDALERAAAQARVVATGTSGRLTLRFTMMSALTVLPRAVAEFHRRYPDVELDLAPCSTADQLELIHAGRCDVGFVPAATTTTGIEVEDVERDELVMIASRKNPLAARRSVTFHEWARQPLILLGKSNEADVRALLNKRLAGSGHEPVVVLEVDHLDALLGFVAVDLGVSIGPGFVRRLRHAGVVLVPLRPTVRAGIRMVWKRYGLSATAKNFLEVLRVERDREQARRD